MFVYALAQPIDFFDGLIPLPRWIAEDPDSNTAWALRATLALADARAQAGWTGSMRHLPSIGAVPVPGTAELFMVIKQGGSTPPDPTSATPTTKQSPSPRPATATSHRSNRLPNLARFNRCQIPAGQRPSASSENPRDDPPPRPQRQAPQPHVSLKTFA